MSLYFILILLELKDFGYFDQTGLMQAKEILITISDPFGVLRGWELISKDLRDELLAFLRSEHNKKYPIGISIQKTDLELLLDFLKPYARAGLSPYTDAMRNQIFWHDEFMSEFCSWKTDNLTLLKTEISYQILKLRDGDFMIKRKIAAAIKKCIAEAKNHPEVTKEITQTIVRKKNTIIISFWDNTPLDGEKMKTLLTRIKQLKEMKNK